MTGGRRGPRHLTRDAAEDFLRTRRWAALCVESATGDLISTPVRIAAAGESELGIVAVDDPAVHRGARRRAPGCVVSDEFESYEAIRGVIVQGVLHEPESGTAESGEVALTITTMIGFSFAGTLPPELTEAGPELE
jgi:hypothetical protein